MYYNVYLFILKLDIIKKIYIIMQDEIMYLETFVI